MLFKDFNGKPFDSGSRGASRIGAGRSAGRRSGAPQPLSVRQRDVVGTERFLNILKSELMETYLMKIKHNKLKKMKYLFKSGFLLPLPARSKCNWHAADRACAQPLRAFTSCGRCVFTLPAVCTVHTARTGDRTAYNRHSLEYSHQLV